MSAPAAQAVVALALAAILSTPAPQADTFSNVPPTLSGACRHAHSAHASQPFPFCACVCRSSSVSVADGGGADEQGATGSKSGSSTPGRPRRCSARPSASAPASAAAAARPARGPSTSGGKIIKKNTSHRTYTGGRVLPVRLTCSFTLGCFLVCAGPSWCSRTASAAGSTGGYYYYLHYSPLFFSL